MPDAFADLEMSTLVANVIVAGDGAVVEADPVSARLPPNAGRGGGIEHSAWS